MSLPLVAVVVGTRPEAIKLSSVILELRRRGLPYRVVLTGQHIELATAALREFGIAPDADLAVGHEEQQPLDVIASVLRTLPPVLADTGATWVMVQGDTTSALAGALVAHHLSLRTAHVEAGLRTGDLRAPWPEEANRQLIDALADLHLAPTESAKANLAREGHVATVTGNTGVDAARMAATRPASARFHELMGQVGSHRLVLVTAHRRESHGPGVRNIVAAVGEIAALANIRCLVLEHPNPAVRNAFASLRDAVILSPPLGFTDTIHLVQRAELVLTDSGGIAEETTTFGVPTVILRDQTERTEALTAGAVLAGTDPTAIVEATRRLLADPPPRIQRTVFGDGHAASRTVDALLEVDHDLRSVVTAGGQP